MAKNNNPTKKTVETLKHSEAQRRHIPTAELQSILSAEQQSPLQVAYQRRNPDLDPQLVWRGKDLMDWSDLVVQAPPLYIQEKIHPKVLIDDLRRQSEAQNKAGQMQQLDLFADFNGLPEGADKTEFYQHDANWSNRMILGDSLQVMASLAEREGLRGQVQCIYIDPPYGIKFNSNFQWSTTSRDVKDTAENITREPEQVKAFRDTWRNGIHSYFTYLQDRLIIARDLLANSGSIFVQIGDENSHRVRSLLEEVFGEENYCGAIIAKKTGGQSSILIPRVYDTILWFAKNIEHIKYRAQLNDKVAGQEGAGSYTRVLKDNGDWRPASQSEIITGCDSDGRSLFAPTPLTSDSHGSTGISPYIYKGKKYSPPIRSMWKTTVQGLDRLRYSNRIVPTENSLRYVRYINDFPAAPLTTIWDDLGAGSFTEERLYVVQTRTKLVQRCVLMTTDPGDLVLDPTCGSGTTAYVSEQWGRRWITIDTSRVALALARIRIMGARYPYYLLKDSRDGQLKEAELTHNMPSNEPTYINIRQGFVYERVPHIMLKDIANNTEIDVIWEKYQEDLEPIRIHLNQILKQVWEEWEVPRDADKNWSTEAKDLHQQWWKLRIARQKEIDASIAAKAEYEFLYDRPYEDNKKVRVAGPFTVESLSPHRMLGVDENDELIDTVAEGKAGYAPGQNFEQMILENLKSAGVQQAHKQDKISFFSLSPWPGYYICAEGRYFEGGEEKGREKRAGIFIGPEFGTVGRPDLVAAAREAGDAGFDVLISCAFNYDARSTEFSKLGAIPVLKARMNADLHMADDLKNTGKGNLFVIFGEPDITLLDAPNGQIRVRINGVDVFDPSSGEVRSDGAAGIACWFIDSDYNEESFFVRQAYFLGANDPYSALKTTLKAEVNEDAWASLNSDTSRPFDKPASGRIAVKVINHLGDEVMKVFKVH
jgi:adenine-specific DNA-methyltransferase